MIDSFTLMAYQSTMRGLKADHKTIFTILLSLKIQQSKGLAGEEHLHVTPPSPPPFFFAMLS